MTRDEINALEAKAGRAAVEAFMRTLDTEFTRAGVSVIEALSNTTHVHQAFAGDGERSALVRFTVEIDTSPAAIAIVMRDAHRTKGAL